MCIHVVQGRKEQYQNGQHKSVKTSKIINMHARITSITITWGLVAASRSTAVPPAMCRVFPTALIRSSRSTCSTASTSSTNLVFISSIWKSITRFSRPNLLRREGYWVIHVIHDLHCCSGGRQLHQGTAEPRETRHDIQCPRARQSRQAPTELAGILEGAWYFSGNCERSLLSHKLLSSLNASRVFVSLL